MFLLAKYFPSFPPNSVTIFKSLLNSSLAIFLNLITEGLLGSLT